MTKPLVHYRRELTHYIKEGESALVYPIDHPDSANVSNQGIVRTSKVVSYNSLTGKFETQNTIYVPKKEN